jgi:Tfp pilus assembly protein PilF
LAEASQLLQSSAIKADANRSGFAGCVFRFLSQYSEPDKRVRFAALPNNLDGTSPLAHGYFSCDIMLQIPCLRILVLLAQDDHSATVRACQVAAQGRPWKPNMFILSLQKRHPDNEVIRELATELLNWFSIDMPIESPVQLGSLPSAASPINFDHQRARTADPYAGPRSPVKDNALMLPELVRGAPQRPPFSPTTTISALYIEAPSPYSSTRLPITRPPTSPLEQSRRAMIYSTPKLDAIDGEKRRRCRTPYMNEEAKEGGETHDEGFDSLPGSPIPSPDASSGQKKKVVISEKYAWNPECINSVSGFEWWWRSLPQNHASLEPTQKLKAVTKAAVRMHTRGELQRAIELYQLALSSDINAEVEFRLRINLACAFEAANDLQRSVSEFRRAAELNPADAYAKYKLGDVLVATGEFEEARQLYREILGVYPQAADALVVLQRAEEDQRQKEAAERAALTAAKASRRSPTKELDAPEAKVEATPTPPSASKSTKRVAAPRSMSSRVHRPSDQNGETPTLATSASVGTVTDLVDSPPASVGNVLTIRCRELRVDLRDCFARMDPHHSGVVRREAVARMMQILCGVDLGTLSEESLKTELKISLDDWEKTDDEQVLLRYESFLAAHVAKLQALPSVLPDNEVERVAKLLDELVSGEAGLVSHTVELTAETGVLADDRRVGPDESDLVNGRDVTSGPIEEGHSEAAASAESDSNGEQQGPNHEHHLQPHQPAANSPPRMTLEGRSPSSTSLADAAHPDRSVLGTILDGYTSLSPRMDDKRGKAWEAEILKAEKARVLARKHMHCLKSLRDIAARARKHVDARRVARAYLLQVAHDTRATQEVRRQVQTPSASVGDTDGAIECVGASLVGGAHEQTKAGDANEDANAPIAASARKQTEDYHSSTSLLKTAASSVYEEAVWMALRRIHSARNVQALQSLARQFAAEYCHAPVHSAAEQEIGATPRQ